MSITYSDVKAFLEQHLTDDYHYPAGNPLLNPGPFSLAALQKLTPNRMVFATVGNGAGLTYEQTYDQVFVTVRCVGLQNDYDDAETLAHNIDRLLLGVQSGLIGSSRVLYVTRSGGAPQLIDYDSAQRYHFQTTYIAPATTGL